VRLQKGGLIVDNLPRNGGKYCIGLLLYRKNGCWYYSLTSPHNKSQDIVTSIQRATRGQIIGGIEEETIKYYPPPKRIKRAKIQKR
tara:strand:+ start:5622 stop:5879 length:258 start_codon:yes stop_codon:yes gene_type:complete